MISLEFFPEWFVPLMITLIIGLLIGLEQETPPRTEPRHFGGVTTLPLVSIGGFVSAHWWAGQPVFLVGLGVLGLLVAAAFMRGSQMTGTLGITQEIATLLCWLLGGLVAAGEWVASLVIAVTATLVLAGKKQGRGEAADKVTIAKFALLAVIVYLILPDQGFTELNINPRQVWSMVVLVSGIACIGYFMLQGFGPERGILATALLGGLVSSVAVTLAFARLSQKRPELASALTAGILLTASVMFARQMLEVAIVNPKLLPITAVLLLPALTTGLWLIWRTLSKANSRHKGAAVATPLENPLELSTVIQFGALYGLVFAVAQLAINHFGPFGVYTISLLAGSFDTDAITLALAQLNTSGAVPTAIAVLGIAMASVSNLAIKLAMVWACATRSIAIQTATGLAAIAGIATVAIAAVLLMAWRAV
ncbi:MAG: MgtC/SapB family protein [Pseudomonadota bacterium]